MSNMADLAFGQVVTAPSPATSGTSITFQAGEGVTFPTPPFYMTGTPPGQYTTKFTSEIVYVTAKSTDTFTIVRAQKGTTAKTITTGWVFVNGIYTDDLFSSSLNMGETMGGSANGSNMVFTTANPFTEIEPFYNGIRLKEGDDFTVTNSTTITMAYAPVSGASMVANYITGSQLMVSGSNSLIAKEAAVGTVNGSNASFSVSRGSYIPTSLQVFVNGLRQSIAHVTETDPSIGTFTLDVAPLTGDNVEVAYQFVSSVSGNADTVDGYHANTVYQAIPHGVMGDMQTFTSSGTWTKPANLKFIIIEVQAAGGAGGGSTSTAGGQMSVGEGGSGGGYVKTKILASALSSTETVTIGTFGTGSSSSAGGGASDTTFGSIITATGGGGGSVISATTTLDQFASTAPTGGSGSGGSIIIPGQAGGWGLAIGSSTGRVTGGMGGDSVLGVGGKHGRNGGGNQGRGYGAGGGGASGPASAAAYAGGNGAPGIVIITEFF